MLKQNHPDDERLSALTSRDPDATADATLTTHVASCDRCGELVADLGALRASLADLPDLEPPRRLTVVGWGAAAAPVAVAQRGRAIS